MTEQNSNYIIGRDGSIFQLIPVEWDVSAFRERLTEATPEMRIEAAQRYMQARYVEAVRDGLIELFAAAYPEEPE
jgi:hypothetical protein